MKVRFSGTPGGGFPVVDPGEYKVKLSDVEEGISKEEKQNIIACRVVIVGGQYDGVSIPHNWSLQTQAVWRLEQDMWALGLISQERAGKPFELESADIAAALKDTECLAVMFTDTYKGTERSKVASLKGVEVDKPAVIAPTPKAKRPF